MSSPRGNSGPGQWGMAGHVSGHPLVERQIKPKQGEEVRERSPIETCRKTASDTEAREESLKDKGKASSKGLAQEGLMKELKVSLRREITPQQQEGTPQQQKEIFSTLPEKRPGRPVTTGEYEKEKERMAKEAEEKELQKEKDILDPLIKPSLTKLYKEFLERIKDKEKKFRNTLIVDLEAMVSEKTTDIYEVAVNSGTMKETYARQAKEAAADMCAAATVLALKAQNPTATPVYKQLEELRQQMHTLRMENMQLRRMVEKLKGPKKTQTALTLLSTRGDSDVSRDKDLETPTPFRKPLRGKQLSKTRTEKWINETLLPLEGRGVSITQEDRISPHFHL
ncbi:hypothetical protein RF55_4393 [Lasius niger]|uniref:Uncharacterized protein n=1 Tax=Lasius niger TaxID=67767 RepID=A0A0J7NSI7_LASNI|nr:hypothetical protein RF55_4393 [Lasius niger]